MFKLSDRSEKNLKGVKPELVQVVRKAIELTTIDFVVTEGLRTVEREEELIKKGASDLKDARRCKHVIGCAVDVAAIVDNKISYNDKYYDPIADAFFKAAEICDVHIVWGGDWKSKDYGHFQLN